MSDQDKPTTGKRFVMNGHIIFDIQANAFIGVGDACYLLNESNAALVAERERLKNDEVHRQQAVQEIYADKLADLEAQLAAERESSNELCKQVEDYHRIVSFFRNEGYSEFGFHGDESGWSPCQTAIEGLKTIQQLRSQLATAGEWTEGKVFAYFESEDFAGLAQAINAALDAEREKVKQLLGSKHCPAPENELGDSSGDVSGWDLIPVVKSNGELWLGLATIRLRNRPIATLNEQEAKGLLAAISAELAAERERLENDEVHRQQAVQEIYADKIADLEAQLSAERKAGGELIKMHTEAVIKCNEARKQLAGRAGKDWRQMMWTYQIDSGYWRIYERGVEIGTVLSELNASSIVAAHNGALASERERTRNIISERNELAVAVQEWKDASNEHAAMRVKFREQLDAEREKVQTLVDALKEFENEYPHVTRLLETVR